MINAVLINAILELESGFCVLRQEGVVTLLGRSLALAGLSLNQPTIDHYLMLQYLPSSKRMFHNMAEIT